MSKAHHATREDKKKPTRSFKEKRAEKRHKDDPKSAVANLN